MKQNQTQIMIYCTF